MDSRPVVDGPPDARVVGGRYRLLSPLGSGGMGTVWRAEDAVLGRHVAVKEVVFPRGLSDEDRATLRERTRREARAAARLDHPSAVTVYDVVEQDGEPWLVLELVEARTLAETVRGDGPLSPWRTAQVGLAVLGALEAAHRQGIVHRDVKPSNVLLGDASTGGRVVLTDFGIASSAGDSSITSTGLLLGSPSYIAPERARGQTPGPPSDLWSLGATLFTAVEGRPPYDKGEPLTTLTAVVNDDREPYLAAGPLATLLDGLLQPDPALRLDAHRARQLLQQVVAAAPTPTPAAAPAPLREAASEQTAALPLPAHLPLPSGRLPAPTVPSPSTPPSPPPSTSTPPSTRGPASAPGRGRRRAGLLAGAAAGLLALGGVGYGLSALAPGPGGGAPSGDSSARPSADASGPTDDVVVPDGWVTVSGAAGWTAAAPASWRVTDYQNGTQFKEPESRRTLRVTTGAGAADAVADRRNQARAFAERFPSYAEIGIAPVPYRGQTAADWEFTYTDGGADLHVVNRVVNVDGIGHSLFFQTRAADWPAAREDFEALVAAFRPAGT